MISRLDQLVQQCIFDMKYYRIFLQMRVTIENTDEPKRMLLDRNFNLCPILKYQKMFPAIKAFVRDRVSVPLRCPLKKGEVVIKLRRDLIDPLNLMQILGEVKRLSPALTVYSLKKTFALRIQVFTKFQTMSKTLGSLTIESLRIPDI